MTGMHSVQFNANLLRHIRSYRNDEAKSMITRDLMNASDNFGTLLHYASAYGNGQIVCHLINFGSEVDSVGKDGKTPLMVAVEFRNGFCVDALLHAGANMDISDAEGKTAVQKGARDTNPQIYEAFIDRLKYVVSSTEELVDRLFIAGFTLSQVFSLRDQYIEVVKGMLQRGSDINSRNNNGETVLHRAVTADDFELVRFLVDYDADVNALDHDGFSPLMHATKRVNALIMKLLLERGANLNFENFYPRSYTPLSALFASRAKDMEQLDKCVAILLQHGAFPKDKHQITGILCRAPKRVDSRAIDYLIGHMAMLEMIGSHPDAASIERCREMHDPFDKVSSEERYKFCQQILKMNVFKSFSLLDLLAGSEYKLRLHLRNEIFNFKIEKFCAERELSLLYPYYYVTLTECIAKASRIVKLEDEAILVISDIFQRNENECYVAAKEIVGYLNERDLQHFCRAIVI